jgi:hypothetical protein
MKRFLLATAAVAGLAISVPASAQGGDLLRQGIESILGGGSGGVSSHIGELNSRIQSAYQRGDISQSEASRLQSELRAIAQREQSYRSGGISRSERDDLHRRLQSLESRIQQASYNRDGRDGRDDHWDDRDGRWDDRNDRDERWSDRDRRNGRDCPPGLAKKSNGCQPPGQAMKQGDRYNSQYGRVPASYGERYRDTQRYLYRYNDGRIYQVDRRTGRVVRVSDARR